MHAIFYSLSTDGIV